MKLLSEMSRRDGQSQTFMAHGHNICGETSRFLFDIIDQDTLLTFFCLIDLAQVKEEYLSLCTSMQLAYYSESKR